MLATKIPHTTGVCFVAFVLLTLSINITRANWILNKITCEVIDKSLIIARYCYVKPVKRNLKYFAIKFTVKQKIFSNLTYHIQLNKRANGWKPFLYNIKVDACRFLRYQKNPILGPVFEAIKHKFTMTNGKFECPFEGDITIGNVTSDEIAVVLDKLPIPLGQYAVFMTSYLNDGVLSHINLYLEKN